MHTEKMGPKIFNSCLLFRELERGVTPVSVLSWILRLFPQTDSGSSAHGGYCLNVLSSITINEGKYSTFSTI